ncbi:endonuclease/exonuclease/phosphatase family protein [Saccharothrix sp. ALI-22-I]|uniref:endonuclease/exonuclease/phosphatase family protein n=1 Tax=Saccharothrix sp. ALI-22-I TaxID=1933778 RepID=UPI001179E117|nr:endonuclease/exonuclease/phosphatase family protein [Saccharothrix sp. ALI-22-I]
MGSIRVAWWNLENLFDTKDDPISNDFDFTPAEGWTDQVYAAKRANLAAALNELGPELLGVCEVEGDDVFAALLADTGNTHLKVAVDPEGTSDLRGIDVSVAYDDRKLRVLETRSHVVHLRYATRDIFEVVFEVVETGARLVAIASHWPSRRQGRLRSEPLRIAVAENISYLVRDHVRFDSLTYEELRAADDLAAVQARWETPVLIMGDFNDEPSDRSVVEHLQASSELDRVVGPTNAITAFAADGAAYRGDDTWLFNACWKFLAPENSGTFFLDATRDERFANRYQVLDQIVVSRGLLSGPLRLDPAGVTLHQSDTFATQPLRRPRKFNRTTLKGTSDHLPLTARIDY